MKAPDTAPPVVESGHKNEHRSPPNGVPGMPCKAPLDIFAQIPDSGDRPDTPSWHPTASQRQGLSQLHELANVFDKVGNGKMAGFQPSCRRALIIGTSGSGKTALAGHFAVQRGVPIHVIDAGSWLVAGSLVKPGTLRGARDFIRSCNDSVGVDGQHGPGLQGIIYVDECCKMVPTQEAMSQSGWALAVASEGISLADADGKLTGHEWSPRDIERLGSNFMLLAGGAFQAALVEARKCAQRGSLGFGEAGEKTTYSSKITEYLPEEILSRFSSTVVVLEAPTRADLTEAITRIHAEMGIKRYQPMDDLLNEAESAQGAMRWVENYVCRLIAKHPYSVRPAPGPRQKPSEAPKEGRTYDMLVGDIPRCVAGANETIGKLQIKLAVIYSRLHAMANLERQTPWTGMLANQELGESIIRALRNSQLLTTITADDEEEISALAQWRTVAWQTLTENASDLATYGLTETIAEAWALSGALVEYRRSLSRAVQRGLLG